MTELCMPEPIPPKYNPHDFLDGMYDCREGIPHKHINDSYTAGYNTQYQLEQLNGGQN